MNLFFIDIVFQLYMMCCFILRKHTSAPRRLREVHLTLPGLTTSEIGASQLWDGLGPVVYPSK